MRSIPRPPFGKQLLGLAFWLGVSFLAAGIGAMASAGSAAFYGALVQPSWAPPAAVFGPVWSVLYVLMGLSAWLVWRDFGVRRAYSALALFVAQLTANALWTWVFFVWHQGALAVVEILLLWLLIAATVRAFWRFHRLAACLLLPYLAWVSFATALTVALWRLNPVALG